MKIILLLLLVFSLAACGGASSSSSDQNDLIGSLPRQIVEPVNNTATPEKIALGRLLFWDPILSGNQDVACATCHHPENAYAEHRDLSIGVGGHGLSEERDFGALVKRNSPTIVNTAYKGIDVAGHYDPSNTVMFWDNRSESLEAQALEPIKSLEEMRGEAFAEGEIIHVVSQRLSNNAEYVRLFIEAFGDNNINGDRIAKAIAAFERTLVSFNSPFDRYARGDGSALTQQQVRGLNDFVEAGCNACHSGPMFSDFELHEIPIPENETLLLAGIDDDGEAGKFRTPSLRNVELTAPYMHNGSIQTLREAITIYDGMENPSDDPELNEMEFEMVETESVAAIEAFLRALTDESFDKTIPKSVPSGLNPGGNL